MFSLRFLVQSTARMSLAIHWSADRSMEPRQCVPLSSSGPWLGLAENLKCSKKSHNLYLNDPGPCSVIADGMSWSSAVPTGSSLVNRVAAAEVRFQVLTGKSCHSLCHKVQHIMAAMHSILQGWRSCSLVQPSADLAHVLCRCDKMYVAM